MNKIQKQFIKGLILFQFIACSYLVILAFLTNYFTWVMIGQIYANSVLK